VVGSNRTVGGSNRKGATSQTPPISSVYFQRLTGRPEKPQLAGAVRLIGEALDASQDEKPDANDAFEP
jgi:hypothetical protein